MKKRLLILTVITILTLTSMSFAMGEGFNDVTEEQWFYDSVTKMTEQDIFKGYPDGTFKPDNTVTYGEFIKMFVVATTGEDVGNSTEGHWVTNYYDKGIELGLYTEYDIMSKDFDNNIPRKIMAFMVANHFYGTEIKNYDLVEASIQDLDQGKPYQHEIIKSYGMGILTGYEDGSFKPNGTLTRAESATVINRILNENERVIPTFENVDKEAYWRNDPDYDEMVDWIETNKERINGELPKVQAPVDIIDGKVYVHDSTGNWTPDNSQYENIHEDIYNTLKTYYQFAKEKDLTLTVGGNKEYNRVTIGIKEKSTHTNDLFDFSFEGKPTKEGEAMSYVCQQFNKLFTDSSFNSYEEFVEYDRIGDEDFVEVNRKVFQQLYGKETGSKMCDYAKKVYIMKFDKENQCQKDLDLGTIQIDGYNVFHTDEVGGTNLLYIDEPL